MNNQLVIDTDVGADVDDLIALIYAIRNNKERIKAIITVHGDTVIRAKIVKKLEKMLGVNIPIIAGTARTLSGNRDYWCGFEHEALTPDELRAPFANNHSLSYNSRTSLVCIGPLTNIALNLENDSDISMVRNIYFMGSHSGSHNFKADPRAAEIVLAQKWNKFFVTKEVSKKICFSKRELKTFRGTELGEFVYGSAMRWLDYSGKNEACMYDVLAVSAALGENFVKFKQDNGNMVSYDVDSAIKGRIAEAIKNGI
ncbi:MAG: nucleoside hydrolase [archaeon]